MNEDSNNRNTLNLNNRPFIIEKTANQQVIFKDLDKHYAEGIVIPVYKPFRWTSADVVRKIKSAACKFFGKKNLKVGHAGTLDPLAGGLLIVCIGKATRWAEYFQNGDKEYLSGFSFGATTPSFDREKEIDHFFEYKHISEDLIKATLTQFIGSFEQAAPLFSAKSVNGIRAYKIARNLLKKKETTENYTDDSCEITIKKHRVSIHNIELLSFSPDGEKVLFEENEAQEDFNPRINLVNNSELHLPRAEFKITCSKGTYIRSLARDLGEALKSGAHIDFLRRTKSSDFCLEQALSITEAEELFKST